MSEHTPGPWSVRDAGGKGEPMMKVVGKTPRHEIALCCTGAVSQDEETANAHVIAAAPDMLEALKHCLREHGGFTICGETERMAKAAIAKAEGRR